MCQALSLNSDGQGNIYFFTLEQRLARVPMPDTGEPPKSYDSHTSIAVFFRIKEDLHNKWEVNPYTGKLVLDQQNTADDREAVQAYIDAQIFTDGWIERWRPMLGDIQGVCDLIAEAKTIQWLSGSGTLPESPHIRVYETMAAAWAAARAAAGVAALMAVVRVVDGLPLAQQHIDHAKLRWAVWQAGYGVFCDTVDEAGNVILHCYKHV